MNKHKIYCAGCNKYLGEIRDATLFKGIKYLCLNCDTKRIASDIHKKTEKKDDMDWLFSQFQK